MKVIMILATGLNGELGQNGQLPWSRIPLDMLFFKRMTKGKNCIVGMNTYMGLPNIVIAKSTHHISSNTKRIGEIINDLKAIFIDEVFVIGGAKTYEAAMPYVDEIYWTKIDQNFPDADTFFDVESELSKLDCNYRQVDILSTEPNILTPYYLKIRKITITRDNG